MEDIKRKMQETTAYAKEKNETLEFALHLLTNGNPELARIMKELENAKKS